MPNATKQSHIPNAVTRTLVCVDGVADADFSGTVYNPYLPQPVPFAHFRDLVGAMEGFFDSIAYPQPYFQPRTFLENKAEGDAPPPESPVRYHEDTLFDQHRGAIATFEVEVKYRQSATWQGEITWLEERLSRSFRSMLEMIKLMDGAITRTQNKTS